MPPEAQPAEQHERPPVEDYQIGPEDVVEVMVWKNEDLSRVVSVRPDGKISLPLIGDLVAAGQTAEQLKASIAKSLKQYYKEPPQVSVIVQQVNSYVIYILGQVQTPGRYVVKSGTTFLQALSLAGGFTTYANTKRIVLRRQRPEGKARSLCGFALMTWWWANSRIYCSNEAIRSSSPNTVLGGIGRRRPGTECIRSPRQHISSKTSGDISIYTIHRVALFVGGT